MIFGRFLGILKRYYNNKQISVLERVETLSTRWGRGSKGEKLDHFEGPR